MVDVAPHEVQVPAVDEKGLKEVLDGIKVQRPASNTASGPEHSSDENEYTAYKSNNKKEKELIKFAENFRRQFRQLFGDRKALFINPPNECGVKKFICTTLRPTCLPYKILYTFDGCATFVADYLNYEPMKEPNELPEVLYSPTLVLKKQSGNCFDYAVLLCSLLIGVGYDAYCVCGYASVDVTLLNQTRKTCPLLKEPTDSVPASPERRKDRYAVKPTRELSSKFLRRQEAKEKAKLEEEERKRREEELSKAAEAEKPPPDKYYGLRFHCWVLVLSGKREVAQSFFIEPTTGESVALDWEEYLGIESLWNHKNYWINMQDCSLGVKNMVYDLGDASKWEFFFPNVEKPLLVIPGEDIPEQEEEKESARDEDFELPASWVLPIKISPSELETRCPNGRKTVLYRKAKLEKYADYLHQDGLITQLILYEDTARAHKVQVRNYFAHRNDHLESQVESVLSGQTHEQFGLGRQRALKEHIYYPTNPLKAHNRIMKFYSNVRTDGLVERVISATELTECFEGREDFLYYRKVTYGKIAKKFEPSESVQQKPIVTIVEKFHHDPSKPPNSDVAEHRFMISENHVKVIYHLEENRITCSSREFTLPAQAEHGMGTLTLNPEMTTAYQVDPYADEPKKRHLFELLERLVKAQEESIDLVRASEKETESILNARLREEMNISLSISVYDVDRNETAKKHREEIERKRAEDEKLRKLKEMDYLAPFLARIGDPPSLDYSQMQKVTEDCLKDLRERLVDMANMIQKRFEKETEQLQKKQAWYKQNQANLTKEKEVEYVSYCEDAMFRIHILEQRLERHKLIAPKKYNDLDKRLKSDSRLKGYFG